MIKLRIVSLSILLLFFSSGCVPYFQKSPVSQKNETIIPAKIEPESNSVAVTNDPPAPAQKPSDTPPPAPKHDPSEVQKLSPSPVKENPDNILPPEPPKPVDLSKTAPPVAPEKTITASPATVVKQVKPTEKTKQKPLSPQKIQSILDESLDFCQASQDFWQKGELENAFEALDQAYSLILMIDNEEIKPELIQQKEDLRFLISKRILEIYASRHIVVNGEYNAIPLEINKHVQREIDLFTRGREKNFFIESYKRSGRYHARIVSALEEAGLPVELSWLPLIESGFKVNALSRARALGLWQFIPSTGYKFGLKRNTFIDERLDPEKATTAAIAYLKELHQIFGDWTTVLAAYNCGEGRVLRIIRGQNVNYLDNFWDLYQRLPRETARYVPRYLATLHILNNMEKYGFDQIPRDPPLAFETVSISKQVHLKDVASALGIQLKTLKKLNPELRYQILPRERYTLRVPPGKGELLLAKADKIPISYRPRPAYVKHRVRPGESLSSIAHRYRTSVRSIARANNIYKHNFIVAGKTLKIPQKGRFTYKTKKYTPRPRKDKHPTDHIVKSGDSLWIIARRYSTTTKEIQTLNKLTKSNLHIGQVLKIPGVKTEPPPKNSLRTYRVKGGDSPFKIAQRHKMPLEQFLRINRLTPRSKIFPGQKLFVE